MTTSTGPNPPRRSPVRAAVRNLLRMGRLLKGVRLKPHRGTWIVEEKLFACPYPKREADLAALAAHGILLIVNLHERAHDPALLARYGLTEVHLPVADFTPPSPPVIERGITAIAGAIEDGRAVAVHCAAGLGRTGTLLACFLVSEGLDADEAIRTVRSLRPGSIETEAQAAAVAAYARSRPHD